MQSIALVIHVLLAVGVIGLVLIQHGKGADAGAAFGSGASATVFGASGATSFLTRMTTIGAVLFFATSLFLFWIAAHRDGVGVQSVTDAPGLVDETVPGVVVPLVDDGDLPGSIAPSAPDATPDGDLPAAPAVGTGTGSDGTVGAAVEPVPADGDAVDAVEAVPAPADEGNAEEAAQ